MGIMCYQWSLISNWRLSEFRQLKSDRTWLKYVIPGVIFALIYAIFFLITMNPDIWHTSLFWLLWTLYNFVLSILLLVIHVWTGTTFNKKADSLRLAFSKPRRLKDLLYTSAIFFGIR